VRFTIKSDEGLPIRGNLDVPRQTRALVIIVHGFKGFKDWGMFPPLTERLAQAGFTAVSLNLSGSGVDDPGEFSLPDRFAPNTFSAQLDAAGPVLDAPPKVEPGVPSPPLQAEQIQLFRAAWAAAGHEREPRVSVSRSIFPIVDDTELPVSGLMPVNAGAGGAGHHTRAQERDGALASEPALVPGHAQQPHPQPGEEQTGKPDHGRHAANSVVHLAQRGVDRLPRMGQQVPHYEDQDSDREGVEKHPHAGRGPAVARATQPAQR